MFKVAFVKLFPVTPQCTFPSSIIFEICQKQIFQLCLLFWPFISPSSFCLNMQIDKNDSFSQLYDQVTRLFKKIFGIFQGKDHRCYFTILWQVFSWWHSRIFLWPELGWIQLNSRCLQIRNFAFGKFYMHVYILFKKLL